MYTAITAQVTATIQCNLTPITEAEIETKTKKNYELKDKFLHFNETPRS